MKPISENGRDRATKLKTKKSPKNFAIVVYWYSSKIKTEVVFYFILYCSSFSSFGLINNTVN